MLQLQLKLVFRLTPWRDGQCVLDLDKYSRGVADPRLLAIHLHNPKFQD
jgi:hypothetical protein